MSFLWACWTLPRVLVRKLSSDLQNANCANVANVANDANVANYANVAKDANVANHANEANDVLWRDFRGLL